jgi:hypothetical protein
MKQKPLLTRRQPDILRILRWTAWGMAALLALAAWPAWRWVAATYGPYDGRSSQCLICCRGREVERVCGRQVLDRIETNEYSDWVDSFVPPEHEHLWHGTSSSIRSHWFGGRVMACGFGMSAVPAIYRQRDELGEAEARRLVLKFRELATTPGMDDRFKELRAFEETVRNDPQSLLEDEP